MRLNQHIIPSINYADQNQRSDKIFLGIIVVLAAFLRLAYFIEIQDNPLPFYVSQMKGFDQELFMSLAHRLVDTHWLGSNDVVQSPAYSYLMAFLFNIFGKVLNVVFLFQISFGILAVYIFYKVTTLLFDNPDVGLVCAFVAAFYSPFIYYECVTLREIMIAYLNLLSFYFLLRAIHQGKFLYFFEAGIMVGLSVVLRPNILPFFILLYILIAIKDTLRVKIPYVFLFILGLAFFITPPIAVRNKILGYQMLLERSNFVFWLSNSYDASGFGGSPTPIAEKLGREANGKIFDTLIILIREIYDHLKEYIGLYGRKFKMLFNGYEIPANLSYDLFKENSTILKIAFFNFSIVSPLAILGLFLMWGKFREGGLLYLYFFVLNIFILLFHIQSRMRVQVIPFSIILAAYCLYWLICMLKKRNFRALSCALVCLAAVSFFTKPDEQTIKKYFLSRIRPLDYMNMANAYLHRYRMKLGRITAQEKQEIFVKVLENYNKGLNISPDSDRGKWSLPEFLQEQNRQN